MRKVPPGIHTMSGKGGSPGGREGAVSGLDAVMNLNPEPGTGCSVYVPCNRGQGNATKGREGTTKG